jgi:hypothetical protein
MMHWMLGISALVVYRFPKVPMANGWHKQWLAILLMELNMTMARFELMAIRLVMAMAVVVLVLDMMYWRA